MRGVARGAQRSPGPERPHAIARADLARARKPHQRDSRPQLSGRASSPAANTTSNCGALSAIASIKNRSFPHVAQEPPRPVTRPGGDWCGRHNSSRSSTFIAVRAPPPHADSAGTPSLAGIELRSTAARIASMVTGASGRTSPFRGSRALRTARTAQCKNSASATAAICERAPPCAQSTPTLHPALGRRRDPNGIAHHALPSVQHSHQPRPPTAPLSTSDNPLDTTAAEAEPAAPPRDPLHPF
jgi:hypothetical protein